MDKSLLPLYRQFCDANGLEIPSNIDSLELHSGFYDWAREMQINGGRRYLAFLDFLGLNYYKSRETAEIGKGVYDSLVIGDEYETRMISPTRVAKNIRGLKKLMLSGFIVANGIPNLASGGIHYALKYGDPFCSFMTQNPYNIRDINGWAGMHNINGYGVIVGVFGRVQDDDRQRKVEIVKDFSERLSDSLIGDYVEDGSYYFCVAGNRPLTLKRGLSIPHHGRGGR